MNNDLVQLNVMIPKALKVQLDMVGVALGMTTREMLRMALLDFLNERTISEALRTLQALKGEGSGRK